jgi:hypothetical protein
VRPARPERHGRLRTFWPPYIFYDLNFFAEWEQSWLLDARLIVDDPLSSNAMDGAIVSAVLSACHKWFFDCIALTSGWNNLNWMNCSHEPLSFFFKVLLYHFRFHCRECHFLGFKLAKRILFSIDRNSNFIRLVLFLSFSLSFSMKGFVPKAERWDMLPWPTSRWRSRIIWYLMGSMYSLLSSISYSVTGNQISIQIRPMRPRRDANLWICDHWIKETGSLNWHPWNRVCYWCIRACAQINQFPSPWRMSNIIAQLIHRFKLKWLNMCHLGV